MNLKKKMKLTMAAIFTDKERCHICGCTFKQNEEFEWGHAIEVYSAAYGAAEYPARVQMHVECSSVSEVKH